MGNIEVICGGMFAGKSDELIRRVTRAVIAKRKVQLFKPKTDDRYSKNEIVAHNGRKLKCKSVTNAEGIWAGVIVDTKVVGVDEAQFFDPNIVDIVVRLANRGKRVIVAGLDQDWTGEPFGPMPQLLAVADDVLKLHAVCINCGERASKSYRKVSLTGTEVVGGKDEYDALCRDCYVEATR